MATKVLDNVRTTQPRDTSANWTQYDPVLRDGEIIIVDTDAGEVRYKVGDGTKKYSQLPFDDEAVRALIANKADNSKVVHTTGDETIAGHKTFSGTVTATSFIGALDYSNLTNVPYIIKEYTNPALTSTAGVCEWTIDHNMGKSTSCRLFDTTLKEDVMATVITSDSNTIVVKFGSNTDIAAGKYKATIIGYEVSA